MNKSKAIVLLGIVSFMGVGLKASERRNAVCPSGKVSVVLGVDRHDRGDEESQREEDLDPNTVRCKGVNLSKDDLKKLASFVKDESEKNSFFSQCCSKVFNFCRQQIKSIPWGLVCCFLIYKLYFQPVNSSERPSYSPEVFQEIVNASLGVTKDWWRLSKLDLQIDASRGVVEMHESFLLSQWLSQITNTAISAVSYYWGGAGAWLASMVPSSILALRN